MLPCARALALASADRSITLTCREETEPGLPWRCQRRAQHALLQPGHTASPEQISASDGELLKQSPRLFQGCEATLAG